jgi:hypothetical protein
MATRSAIAIENEDGSVTAIYCHWDGYLSNNGRILLEHYSDRNKVQELIKLGDISSLREEIYPPKDKLHSYDNPLEDVTIAYHRDRGEPFNNYKFKNASLYAKNQKIDAEYLYLFNKENKWLYGRGKNLVELRKEDVIE